MAIMSDEEFEALPMHELDGDHIQRMPMASEEDHGPNEEEEEGEDGRFGVGMFGDGADEDLVAGYDREAEREFFRTLHSRKDADDLASDVGAKRVCFGT